MPFAKVKDGVLVCYPYSHENLRLENPNTRFDSRFSIPEWYQSTDDAKSTGCAIVPVLSAEHPTHDSTTHYLAQKTTPELIDGVWTIGWDIVERPPVTESMTTSGAASGAVN